MCSMKINNSLFIILPLAGPEGIPSSRGLNVPPGRMSPLLLLILTLTGTALLVLNLAIIACFVRKRTSGSKAVSGTWGD